MTRPKLPRCLSCNPCNCHLKPKGVSLGEVGLMPDEIEALKLHDLDGLDQKEAAKMMKISQPTFARIIKAARNKVSDAILNGKGIKALKS